MDDWEFDSKKFKIEDTIPLLLWPIILSIKLLCPTDEREIHKKLNDLTENNFAPDIEFISNQISEIFDLIKDERFQKKYSDFLETLEVDGDYQKLFNGDLGLTTKLGFHFSDFIKDDPSLEFIDDHTSDKVNLKRHNVFVLPNFVRKYAFFFVNLCQIDEQLIRKLSISIFYYVLIYFLFIESLDAKEESPYITSLGALSNFLIVDKYFGHTEEVIFHIGLWIGTAGFFLFKKGIQFLINDYEKIFPSIKVNKIVEFESHYFDEDNRNYYAFIRPNSENEAGYSIGFFKKIRFLKNKDYYLEFHFERVDPNRILRPPVLTFKSKEDNKTDSEHLLFCLYLLSEKISDFAVDVMESINEFIDDPANSIKNDLNSFKSRMKLIISSYSLFDELLNYKNLFRAVGTLDMGIDDEGVTIIREKIKKTNKYHLSPDLSEKLKEASNELSLLFTSVRGIKYNRNGEAKEYFNNHPHQFKIIQLDDIKDVEFTSEANAIRDARRKVLCRIAKRCGKDIPPSRITKGLGLE